MWKCLNPKLLQLWVRSLNGGPMPTTAELAGIGGYRLDAVIAYLKLARRFKRATPAVPNVAYSGHTAATASRRKNHLNAALRLDPGTGFRDIYHANRPHHRFPELSARRPCLCRAPRPRAAQRPCSPTSPRESSALVGHHQRRRCTPGHWIESTDSICLPVNMVRLSSQ